MNRRTLFPEQAADVRGHTEQAIAEVRAVLEAAVDVGPVLVSAFRAMAALRELRETIDSLPTIPREPGP